jgi:uncharacterized membrane protein
MRHRSPGQTIVFAALAMVALVGGLAMVIDTGMFFVVQRDLHSAADAGALAGAWHDPICPNAVGYAPPCLTSPAAPAMAGTPPSASCDGTSGFPSCDVALANANTIKPLCSGVVHATVSTGTTLIRPSNVNTIVVTLECDAGYSFGRILGLGTKHISASAAAALGNRNATNTPTCINTPVLSNGGDMTNLSANAPCGYVARLIE